MKKIAIALTLCMVLSVVVSGATMAAGKAGAQKAALYPCIGGSSDNVDTTAATQGRVIINDPMGAVVLNIQGNASGLKANHVYSVWVRQLFGYIGYSINSAPAAGYYLLACFTTNGQGKGHFHLNIRAADLPVATYNIQVAINDLMGNDPTVYIGSTVLATVKYAVVTVGS